MNTITLMQGKEFANRSEIGELLGGDRQSGIVIAKKQTRFFYLKMKVNFTRTVFIRKANISIVFIPELAERGIKIV